MEWRIPIKRLCSPAMVELKERIEDVRGRTLSGEFAIGKGKPKSAMQCMPTAADSCAGRRAFTVSARRKDRKELRPSV